jgi:thioredoxin reductase
MAEATPAPGELDGRIIVIGGGPAGLGAAIALCEAGAEVTVLEREPEAGGVPRQCGHPPFGMREFHRVLTGPAYARRLVARARDRGVDIREGYTVTSVAPGGLLGIATPEGVAQVRARRVVLATGARETPRAARLVSGDRPLGVLTTGALQAMIYLENLLPFRAPVIVGTELVSFSALLTCLRAGIRPRAMVEAGARVVARHPSGLLPRLLGVPLLTDASIERICGKTRVEAVELGLADGARREIACDGVLFTGGFVPESTLVRMGHLAMVPDWGGPLVDQFGRCSDPLCFAAGNLLRPVETAGWCYREGLRIGRAVARDLAGELPAPADAAEITVSAPLKLAVPERLVPGGAAGAALRHLQLRMAEAANGLIDIRQGGRSLWRRRGRFLPERRILVPLERLAPRTAEPITVTFAQMANRGEQP